MSFKSNVGRAHVEVGPDQCEMLNIHHPDCTCDSCKMRVDVQCLEPFVGMTNDQGGGVRVCGACAVQMEREDFTVTYRPEVRFLIVHPEMGIFLGSCMGLAIWSKWTKNRGQPCAVVFLSRDVAESAMASWMSGRPDGAGTWPVVPGPGRWCPTTSCWSEILRRSRR